MYNSPNAVLKGIRVDFAKGLEAKLNELVFKDIVNDVKSDSAYEDYLFFDSLPAIKEWIDETGAEVLKDYRLTIRNKAWEYSILVDRYTLNDSKKTLGANIEMQIQGSVDRWINFPCELINSLLASGTSGTAFDGSYFFANSHNIDGSNAIDNYYSGTGTTLAQIYADLVGSMTALRGFVDKNNRPLNVNPRFVVICPSQLYSKFNALQNSELYYNGSALVSNELKGTFEIVINYWQSTSVNDWYLVNANAPIKPFILQRNKEPRWEMKDEVDKRYIKYISTAYLNCGYGNFTSIIMIDN